MKDQIKAGVKIAAVFASIVLGAGFASGKEIISFFVNYGMAGYMGLLLSGIIFAAAGTAVMCTCLREKMKDYNRYMENVAGNKIGGFSEAVLGLFMFAIFAAMTSAFGASFVESFNLPFTAGIIVSGVLCLLCFLYGMEGIIKLNAFLSPLMIIGCIFIGLFTFFFKAEGAGTISTSPGEGGPWYASAIIYASYNIVTAVTILSSLKENIKSKTSAVIAGVFGGFLIALIGLCLALTLDVHKELISFYEIPLLALAKTYGKTIEILFLIVFMTVIFTCAATNGYAVIRWFSTRFHLKVMPVSIGITVLACICAYGGFSNFINVVYPVFGIVGFLEIILIMRYFIKGKKTVVQKRKR